MTGLAALAPIVGRQDELAALRAGFELAPSPAVRVLSGMGGVGKTSLARAYAQRHRSDYGRIWWIAAEHPDFRPLLESLLPPGEATMIADARAAAFSLLAKRSDSWLLILDNVPDPSAALPLLPAHGKGHVLITSQAGVWPDPSLVLPINPMDTATSVQLLIRQADDDDPASAEALAGELGGLPLALTQAAGFVRASSGTLVSYLRLYRERSAELWREGRPPDYPHTVATTWQLAMDRLGPEARMVLNLLSCYAPDEVPLRLLGLDELARGRAVAELRAYSLITPTGADMVSVHRLVQAATRAGIELAGWAERARTLVQAAITEAPATYRTITDWLAVRPHALALLGYLPTEDADTLTLRHHVAYWAGESGDPVLARDQLAEVAPLREKLLGVDHPEALTARHNYAHWVGQAGDAERARELFAECLRAIERVHGPDHVTTLAARNNLARWTGQAGDAAGARDLFAEFVADCVRTLGAEDSHTLSAKRNPGWVGRGGRGSGAGHRVARGAVAGVRADARR